MERFLKGSFPPRDPPLADESDTVQLDWREDARKQYSSPGGGECGEHRCWMMEGMVKKAKNVGARARRPGDDRSADIAWQA